MTNRPEYYLKVFTQLSYIAKSCGVCAAVLSPGSRSAAIALPVFRSGLFKSYVINDERSAAYFALGIARFHQKPVLLVCTSGTAVLNYSPAVAEAFNQRLPLIVLSADRPPEWIGIGENQTIFQQDVFKPNIRFSYHIDIESYKEKEDDLNDFISSAFHCSVYPVPGPVHINLPLREPLYSKVFKLPESVQIKKFDHLEIIQSIDIQLCSKINEFQRILIVSGMSGYNLRLRNILEVFTNRYHIPLLADITANLHGIQTVVHHPDFILQNEKNRLQLRPGLLLTFGKYTVSKKVKEFLRQNKPTEHWHIDPYNESADTYQCLTRTIQATPEDFFECILENKLSLSSPSDYLKLWKDFENQYHIEYLQKLNHDDELYLVSYIMQMIPDGSVLHLGNSMPVRLANEYGFYKQPQCKQIQVYSNRGTSGIDGSVSTAFGFSSQSNKQNFLIIGDQSFIYDSNALWNKYLPDNLKIIVISNKGGNIFRRMEGPSAQAEIESYFASYVPVDISALAKSFHIDYHKLVFDRNDLSVLEKFINEKERTAILEVIMPDKKASNLF